MDFGLRLAFASFKIWGVIMLRLKQNYFLILSLFSLSFCINAMEQLLPTANELLQETTTLDLIKHNGASVLPITNDGKNTYVLLGKETRGYWDDFCGKADPGENHSVITAGREFWEESLIKETIGWSLQKTTDYIKMTSTNTKRVICYNNYISNTSCFTTYITYFDYQTIHKILHTFSTEIKNPKLPHCKQEKTKLCLVDLKDFFTKLKKAQSNNNIWVTAFVYDTKKNNFRKISIWLRPFLVQKLKQYASGTKPSLKTDSDKVIFYQQDQQEKASSLSLHVNKFKNYLIGN